jgi:CPA2 family monovalent cation:H+ antiporter-2
MGVTVARLLQHTRTPFRVLDLDPDRVRRGRKQGMPIEYGDSTNDHVLRRVGVDKARAAIVLLPDARTTRQTLKHCRRLAPKLILVARARYGADIPALVGDGADEVVAEEIQSSLEIANRTMERLGLRTPWLEAETEELRRARLEGFRRFRRPGAE